MMVEIYDFGSAKQRKIETLTDELANVKADNNALAIRVKRYEGLLEQIFRSHEYRDDHSIEQLRSAFLTLRDKQPLNELFTIKPQGEK